MKITYTNRSHKAVSADEINALPYYHKLSSQAGWIKVIETFEEHLLTDVDYFINEGENEADVVADLSDSTALKKVRIVERDQIGDRFVLETIKVFKNRQLNEIYKMLFLDSTEYRQLAKQDYLCIQGVDLHTGIPDYADTQKFFYFYDQAEVGSSLAPYIEAWYDEDGSLAAIDHYTGFNPHDPGSRRTQYLPEESLRFRDLLPECPEYYMHAKIEPF